MSVIFVTSAKLDEGPVSCRLPVPEGHVHGWPERYTFGVYMVFWQGIHQIYGCMYGVYVRF
jgi:hypothetical protein